MIYKEIIKIIIAILLSCFIIAQQVIEYKKWAVLTIPITLGAIFLWAFFVVWLTQ